MLLGWALEASFGEPFNELFQQMVATPLGLTRTTYLPSPDLRDETAATELDG